MSTATRGKGPGGLSGTQRCAVLCIALGPEVAVKILQRLQASELELVAREIATYSVVPGEIVDAVMDEFYEASKGASQTLTGGLNYVSSVLEMAIGPVNAGTLVQKIKGQVLDADLSRFNSASPEALAGVLRGEHPQTVALVLAHLGHRQAAGVLQALDPELAAEVMFRVARMEKVSPEMVALVQQGLTSKQDLALPREMTASGGPGSVAKVLNLMGETHSKALLEAVAGRDESMATQIQALMFVFEDLITLDLKGMQRLLREVDYKELALALKGASDELNQKIRAALSGRAAEALDEEIDMLGPVRVKDVEAAHARIIETVRMLEESGELVIRGADDDVID
jgi:flagellar motor switch protein FliG